MNVIWPVSWLKTIASQIDLQSFRLWHTVFERHRTSINCDLTETLFKHPYLPASLCPTGVSWEFQGRKIPIQ